jgi:hypothetical protein
VSVAWPPDHNKRNEAPVQRVAVTKKGQGCFFLGRPAPPQPFRPAGSHPAGALSSVLAKPLIAKEERPKTVAETVAGEVKLMEFLDAANSPVLRCPPRTVSKDVPRG